MCESRYKFVAVFKRGAGAGRDSFRGDCDTLCALTRPHPDAMMADRTRAQVGSTNDRAIARDQNTVAAATRMQTGPGSLFAPPHVTIHDFRWKMEKFKHR